MLHNKHRHLIFLILTEAVLSLSLSFFINNTYRISFLLISLNFILLTIPWFVYFLKIKNDLFEPILWSFLFAFIIFVLRPIWDIIGGSPFLGNVQEHLSSFNKAIFYSSIGIACFLAIYYSRFSKLVAEKIPKFKNVVLTHKKIIIYSIAFLSCSLIIEFIKIKSLGGISDYLLNKKEILTQGMSGLYLLTIFGVPGAISLCLLLLLKRKYLFVVTLLILLAFAAMGGTKARILQIILTCLVFYHYKNKKLKLKHISILALVFILIFILGYGMRGNFNSLNDMTGKILSIGKNVFNSAENLTNLIISRFHPIDAMTLIVEKLSTPMLGRSFFPSFLHAFVPRVIWPNKPIISWGKILSETYLGHVYGGTGTSASSSILGELYADFHVIGIIIGGIFTGFVTKFSYEYFVKGKKSLKNLILYATIIFPFLIQIWEKNIPGSFPIIISGIAGTFILLSLIK